MRLPLQKILSNVRGLLVAFFKSTPLILSDHLKYHPVFFLLRFFFAGAASKKKQ
jgi:hypothetical protein